MNKIFSIALMALGLAAGLTSCDSDRDSNPTLIQPKEFVLNTPSYAGMGVELNKEDSLQLSWSQPEYTTDNAPLVVSYEIQLGNTQSFSKKYDDTAEDESVNDGADFVTVAAGYTSCVSNVAQLDIDKALNKLNKYVEGEPIGLADAYIRVLATVQNTVGASFNPIYSNVIALSFIPFYTDVSKIDAPEFLWMPGNGNGWNHGNAPVFAFDSSVGTKGGFAGYAYMDGDFKFTLKPEWAEELNNGSFKSSSDNIDLGDQGGGNISYVGEPGMCYVVIDWKEMSITATPCTWSIIGDFNSWNGDVVMTYSTDDHCLVATGVGATSAGWKFRRDASWDVNLGGTKDKLVPNGDNIAADANSVKLYIENQKTGYHCSYE